LRDLVGSKWDLYAYHIHIYSCYGNRWYYNAYKGGWDYERLAKKQIEQQRIRERRITTVWK